MLNKIKAYAQMNVPVKAALWFTICNFLIKGIVMLTLPIFTRLLTAEEYGLFSLYQSWYQIVSIVVTLNLSGAVVNNGLIKYSENKDTFISSILGLSTIITSIFLLVYLINIEFWNNVFGLSSILMFAMFIQLLFEPAYLFWMQKNRFEYKYRSVVGVTIIVALLSPILGIIAVLVSPYKVEARVISYALIQVSIGLLFYFLQFHRGKRFFVKSYWKYALNFNLPLLPHYLSQVILNQADRIMISRMIGDEQTAIYSVTYNISSILVIVINAVNSSYIPTMYRYLKDEESSRIKESSNCLCLMMAIMIAILMLVGPEVISVIAPAEYAEAIWLIPPIAGAVFFTYLYTLFINVEFYYEKTKYTMVVSVIGAVANLLLNYVFINLFGYIAAGYTTLICYILFAVGHYSLAKKSLKLSGATWNIFDSKFLFRLSIAVMLIILSMNLIYQSAYLRYSIIAVLAFIICLKRKNIASMIKSAIRS